MSDRVVRASFLCQSKNEVHLYFGKTGIDVEGDLELIDSFVQAAVVNKEMPKPLVRYKISRGHGKGVPPKRLTVAPVGSLNMRARSQCDSGDACRHSKNSALKA